jgi:hypothetical protein
MGIGVADLAARTPPMVVGVSARALRGLAFVDSSHRGRGFALCLVVSVDTDENEIFARFRRLLEYDNGRASRNRTQYDPCEGIGRTISN